MTTETQVCTRCVMDTTDPEIVFDAQGVCSYCYEFDNVTSKQWHPNDKGQKMLEQSFDRIRKEGKNQEYDCIIGLSGGVDSSYLALMMKEFGLRPLVVHIDAGWNSEAAVHNIERIVKHCGFELYTHVMNWEEVRDLQVAYLKSGIANQDVVQDHAFFATLYHFATKHNIRYVISGGNIATESFFCKAWHHSAMDAINLKAIHKKYGKVKLSDYKVISFFQYFFYYPFVKKMTVIRPLNFMPYVKKEAMRTLQETVGYKDYGRKHGESRFTKFFQNYYLPTKFGYDKRKLHLSSSILSGQLTREQVLAELAEPLCDEVELKEDFEYVAKKLGLSNDELREMVVSPGASYKEYPNWDSQYAMLKKLQSFIERFLRKKVKTYA